MIFRTARVRLVSTLNGGQTRMRVFLTAPDGPTETHTVPYDFGSGDPHKQAVRDALGDNRENYMITYHAHNAVRRSTTFGLVPLASHPDVDRV